MQHGNAVSSLPTVGDIHFRIGARVDNGRHLFHSTMAAANFNHAFVGSSGVGKTYGIQRFALEYARAGVTVFLIDTQGDYQPSSFIKAHGRVAKECRFNIMEFGYLDGSYGINPFVINANELGGGLYHAELNVMNTIRLFNKAIGARQKSLLRRLVRTTYYQAGITNDQSTWSKEPPTIDDMYKILQDRLMLARSGLAPSVFERIAESRKQIQKLVATIKKETERKATSDSLAVEQNSQQKIEEAHQKIEGYIETLKEEVGELAEQQMRAELDEAGDPSANETYSVDRLESLENLLAGMVDSRLFCGPNAVPQRGCINVLDVRSISANEQPAIFRLLLDRIFQSAIRSCTDLNPKVPNIVLGFDEAKVFGAEAGDSMGPLNRIATEGRKFGLGTLFGLQTPSQLSEEVRSVLATIILYQPAKEKYREVKKLWGVEAIMLDSLQPKRDALYSLNSGEFTPVHLFC